MRATVVVRVALSSAISFLALVGAAQAFTWASPVTVSGTDTAYLSPRVGIDASGDVLVAWVQTTTTTFGNQCPCRVRAAYRPAGGSFGAPVDVSQPITAQDGAQEIYLAMASNGDAVVAWNDADDGLPFASIRTAGSGSSFGSPVQLASIVGNNEFGVGVEAVQMDAAGDALALVDDDQAYTGPGAISGDQDIDTQVIRRPAGGAFDTASPQTFGDGDHNYYGRALAMSPDGKAVLTLRVDGVDEATPLGNVSNAVEVTTSSGPGAAFGSTPATIESISDHPQADNIYPVLDTGASLYPMATIDDSGDYAFTYDDSASNGDDTPKVSLDGGSGFATSASASDIAAGPVVMAPSGAAVAFSHSDAGESESVRPAAGAFGTSTSLGIAFPYASSIVNASNESSANGQILFSVDGVGPVHTDDDASIGSADGAFPAPTTVGSNDDNFSFGPQGAINGSGEAAVTWTGGSSGYQVRVAIYANPAPPPITHTLAVKRSGSGAGTVMSSPAGISCGVTCSKAYTSGTQVTLTAKAAAGSKFAGWSGGGCSGTGSCKVTLSADESVTATFTTGGSVPNTKITGHQITKSKRQAKFTFKAVGGTASGFQCALIKQPKKGHKAPKPKFSRCSSPKTYKHVAHGSYKLEVRAVSAAGADRTPAAVSFKI
jgi:hypothetical protein